MNQNYGLPVRVDQLDPQATQFDFRGLPYQPPQQLIPQNLQIATPQLQQMVPFIVGASLAEVLNRSSQNVFRMFQANMLAQYGWRTREFAEMVQNTAWIAEFFMYTRQMQPQQAVETAAAEAAIISMGLLASANIQGLNQYIQNQSIADSLNEAVQRGHHWRAQLQQFQTQLGQAMQGQQYGGMNQPVPMNPIYGGGAPQYGGRPAPYPHGGMGYTGRGSMGYRGGQGGINPAVINTNTGGGPAYGTMNGPIGSKIGSGMKPRANNGRGEMLSMEANGKRTHELWHSAENQQRVEVAAAQNNGPFKFQGPAQQIDTLPVVETPAKPKPTGPISLRSRAEQATQTQFTPDQFPRPLDPQNPEHGFELADGTQVKPAEYSDWTVTLDPATNPYRPVFDPTAYQLLHIRRPDGTVIERLEPRDANMDYKDHELNPQLRQQQRDREQSADHKVVPSASWRQVRDIKPVRGGFGGLAAKAAAVEGAGEDEAAPVDTSGDLPTPEPQVLENVMAVNSLKEAQLKLSMFLKRGVTEPDTPVEFQFDVVTPMVTKEDLTTAMNQMETATSFEELQGQLQDLEEQLNGRDGDYEEVLKTIDTRLAVSISQCLSQNFSLDNWSIDSFNEDYNDLQKLLEEKLGPALVEIFLDRAPAMIGAALSVLRDESLAAYEKQLEIEDTSGLLVFRDRCSITQVPWNFSDLNIDLNGGGVVSEAAMPELHAAITAIFARTEDFPVTFAHRYLQTADKQMIELRQGYLGSDALLMFPVTQ